MQAKMCRTNDTTSATGLNDCGLSRCRAQQYIGVLLLGITAGVGVTMGCRPLAVATWIIESHTLRCKTILDRSQQLLAPMHVAASDHLHVKAVSNSPALLILKTLCRGPRETGHTFLNTYAQYSKHRVGFIADSRIRVTSNQYIRPSTLNTYAQQ